MNWSKGFSSVSVAQKLISVYGQIICFCKKLSNGLKGYLI